MLPVGIQILKPSYHPTDVQRAYVACMADLYGPDRLDKLAEAIGVDPAQIARWHESAEFRDWLKYEMEGRFEMMLPLVWKELFTVALGSADMKAKMEALKLLADRFDNRAMVLKAGVQEAARRFVRNAVPTKRPITFTVKPSAGSAAR